MNYIVRTENMINVGCKFRPNDLSPDTWDHLILFAQEKAWITNKVDEQKKDKDKPFPGLPDEAAEKILQIRKEEGIPAPGRPIFPRLKGP